MCVDSTSCMVIELVMMRNLKGRGLGRGIQGSFECIIVIYSVLS